MRLPVVGGRRRAKERLHLLLVGIATKSIAPKSLYRLFFGTEREFIENAARIVNEEDMHIAIWRGFDQGPILLKHANDLDPEIV